MKYLLFFGFSLYSLLLVAQIEDFTTEQATGFTAPQRGVKNISIVNENVVWALAYDGSGINENVQEFTKTTDGGNLWTPVIIDIGNPELAIAMLYAISETQAWLAVYPRASAQTGGGIYKTTDSGATWQRVLGMFDDPYSYAGVIYFSGDKGICIGDPVDGYFEIYTTTNGGNNWSRVPSSHIPAPQSEEYVAPGAISVYEDHIWWLSSHSRLFRSDDFGSTFNVFSTPLCDFDGAPCQFKFSFSDAMNGYLISQDGALWVSPDGGETWQIQFVNSGIVFGGHLFALPGTNLVFSSGHEDLVGLSYTTDAGNTWFVIDDEVPVTDIKLYKDTNNSCYGGWFGGFNENATEGGIYKLEQPMCCSVDSQKDLAYNVYPNPIGNSFRIEANTMITEVCIYTVPGEKIYTCQPHAQSCTIDASLLTNAIYWAKISMGDISKTVKLIK